MPIPFGMQPRPPMNRGIGPSRFQPMMRAGAPQMQRPQRRPSFGQALGQMAGQIQQPQPMNPPMNQWVRREPPTMNPNAGQPPTMQMAEGQGGIGPNWSNLQDLLQRFRGNTGVAGGMNWMMGNNG